MENANTWELLESVELARAGYPILVCGANEYSFARFRSRCMRLAAFLRTRGVAEGVRVGVCLPQCDYYAELYFAISRIGAAALIIRNSGTAEALRHYISASAPDLMICDGTSAASVRSAVPEFNVKGRIIVAESSFEASDFISCGCESFVEDAMPCSQREPSDLNLVVFTSGITGKPKAVFFTCGEMLLEISKIRKPYKREHRIPSSLVCVSFQHINAWTQLLSCLTRGIQVVFLPHFSASEFLRTVERRRVARAYVTPPMLCQLLMCPEEIRRTDFSELELLSFGYDLTPPAFKEAALRLFPPSVELVEIYGLSEKVFRVTTLSLTALVDGGKQEINDRIMRRLSSVGKPVEGMSISIRGSRGEELEIGRVGDIFVKGVEDSAFLRTDDRGYIDCDGFLHLLGYRIPESRSAARSFGTTVQTVIPSIWQTDGYSAISDGGVGIHVISLLASLHSASGMNELIRRYYLAVRELIPAAFYGLQLPEDGGGINIFSDVATTLDIKWSFSGFREGRLLILSRLARSGGDGADVSCEKFGSLEAFTSANRPDHIGNMPIVSENGSAGGALFFFRYGEGQEFTETEQELMRALGLNLCVALSKVRELADVKRCLELGEDAAAYVKLAFLATDVDGNVIYENERSAKGRALLKQADILPYLESLRSNVRQLGLSGGSESLATSESAWDNRRRTLLLRSFYASDGESILTVIKEEKPLSGLGIYRAMLTPREAEVAELIAGGKSTEEIAEALVISKNTLKVHMQSIYRKLCVKSRSELVARLYQQ